MVFLHTLIAPAAWYSTRMNATLKITRIGNSAGVVLPKEVLARLRVGWDALFLTEAPNGVRLTPHDPNHPLVDGNKRTA